VTLSRSGALKRTPIRRISKDALKKLRAYLKVRREVLEAAHYRCEARLSPDCEKYAHETHHVLPRSAGGFDEAENLLPCCEACHDEIHNKRPAEARELGLLRSAFDDPARELSRP
jgi:5-methylcytosine-specific restriction endonuclease McrA